MAKVVEHETVQQPIRPGQMRTGGDGPLTVGDLRNAIAYLDDDVEITFGTQYVFYRFKWRGESLLQIELNDADV